MKDPFEAVLVPHLWFGLLCEGIRTDERGRLNFQAVFNQIQFFEPPANTNVPPNAFLNGILAIGFTEGLGHFELEIELRNVLAEQVRYWFTQPGRYHFWMRLSPSEEEHRIPFEVGRQIGPLERPDAPLQSDEAPL